MQEALADLRELGGIPSEKSAVFESCRFMRIDNAVKALRHPATEEEAILACGLFPDGEDTSFGLAWALVHFIESAPGWPFSGEQLDDRNAWVRLLRERLERGSAKASTD